MNSRVNRKKPKVATVRVSLTPYGRAAYKFQQAAHKADVCQHPLVDALAASRTDINGGICNAFAKFTMEGMNVCGKHASYILLQAAYRAGLSK